MVQYNPKDWFTFIFRLHRADTVRKLAPMLLGIALYVAVVVYTELAVFHLTDESHLKNITMMHSLLGFVISMLLVFRTNTAYDRWWEGRKLWGGLTNNARNLALKLTAILPSDDVENRAYFKELIVEYAFALKNHLRGHHKDNDLFVSQIKVDAGFHKPNQIAKLLYVRTHELNKAGIFSGEQILFLNEELRSFTDICGACERIKNTPIPFSYSVFLKKFIFFYVMTLPIGNVFSLGYLSIPVVVFIFYVLASLELIAEEIENPFGIDANDLPLTGMCTNIKKHLDEVL